MIRTWMLIALVLVSIGTPPARAEQPATKARKAPARSGLEQRIAAYAKALNLDSQQQSRLRVLLLQQREQMQRLWNDNSIPPAQRVYATRAIGDATADGIREMLTDEQRKRYNPPAPARADTAQRERLTVEDWMNAASSSHSQQ
jgi:hypothetical protein